MYQFILTAGCELAVWFKNGVCCLYPHTTQAWFIRAVAAPSPGHYVHQFLYKKMPYRLIRPPCPAVGGGGGGGTTQTSCCTDPVPNTLHATITNDSALNGSYALTHNATSDHWLYTGAFGNCPPTSGTDGHLDFGCSILVFSFLANSIVYSLTGQCAPFIWTATGVDLTACGGSSNATITVTT